MFTIGEIYKRTNLHDVFGGQKQGGISTPSNHKFIMIFTGPTGEQYGYDKDGWQKNGHFLYTGEGQEGDMVFLRGNKAIRDHLADGKALYLFEYKKQGYVEFVGEMVYDAHMITTGKDKNGNPRKIIVFDLMRKKS